MNRHKNWQWKLIISLSLCFEECCRYKYNFNIPMMRTTSLPVLVLTPLLCIIRWQKMLEDLNNYPFWHEIFFHYLESKMNMEDMASIHLFTGKQRCYLSLSTWLTLIEPPKTSQLNMNYLEAIDTQKTWEGFLFCFCQKTLQQGFYFFK